MMSVKRFCYFTNYRPLFAPVCSNIQCTLVSRVSLIFDTCFHPTCIDSAIAVNVGAVFCAPVGIFVQINFSFTPKYI